MRQLILESAIAKSFISFPVEDWECPQEALPLLSLKAEPSKIHSHTEYGNEKEVGDLKTINHRQQRTESIEIDADAEFPVLTAD